MMGDYRKFNIKMERVKEGYRLWKRGIDQSVCVMESYKDKRSLYFAVSNFLPSETLLREENREYHLLLLGMDQGELIHRDFGAFYINHRGEGSFFKKFTGPSVECYTHFLLVIMNRTDGKTETVLSGTTPFFKPEKTHHDRRCEQSEEREVSCKENSETEGFETLWRKAIDSLYTGEGESFFSEEIDETGACWCRVEKSSPLPAVLHPCRDQITTYGHYLIGEKDGRYFVAIPGRFLKKEQPCREEGNFALWQPIRGGEKFFDHLTELTGSLQEEIFGYWIGEIDRRTGQIVPL